MCSDCYYVCLESNFGLSVFTYIYLIYPNVSTFRKQIAVQKPKPRLISFTILQTALNLEWH